MRSPNGPLRVGIGGPVGSGKTTLTEKLCKALRDEFSIAVVTNDIYTKEDAMMLARLQALPEDRIIGVETGGCPHTAIREDASINLQAIAEMRQRLPDLDIVFIESGGDNLAATFSPDLADLTLYVISVCQGEEIPRKGGPGITRSDFLVINKSDLAPYVNVNLDVMERDAARMRGARPFGFTDLSRGKGLQEVIDFIVDNGGLRDAGELGSLTAWTSHLPLPRRAGGAAFSAEHGGSTDEHRPAVQGPAQQPALLPGARRSRLRLPLDRAAQHARGGGQPFLAGRRRRRLALPDEPQPGAFLAHQGERPAADRRQRSRDDEPARCAGPDGLGPAWRDPSQRAACALRHACPFDPCDGAGLAGRIRRLPPVDQNSAMFFNRHVVDDQYGGLAFEEEGERCSKLLSDPKVKVMVMGNHGILVIGDNVADAFNRMYYFERAAETYIKALWTGRPLRTLSDEVAEKAAREMDDYPGQAERHLADLKAILDEQEPVYRN